MPVDNFIDEVEKALSMFPFVKRLEEIIRTRNSVKLHLHVSENLYVQVFLKLKIQIQNFVLILENKLIYARDSSGGSWHKHPFQNPTEHDFSNEGSRKVTIGEFLGEVQEILAKEKLI